MQRSGSTPPAPVESGAVCIQQGTESKEPVDIYYELHHIHAEEPEDAVIRERKDGPKGGEKPIRALFIMGFAATSSAWYPLLRQLQSAWVGQPVGWRLEALLVDNRGIGESSCPKDKFEYSTVRMAQDALAVMDHLGWDKAHVVGFSMGGMIAIKLAAHAPSRLLSLAILSSSAGGTQVLPRSWRAFKYAVRAGICARTPEDRAEADLRFHFTKATLKRVVPGWGVRVKDVLYEEYLSTSQTGKPQPKWAFKGQAHAVWDHHVSRADVRNIKAGRFPVWFIHGRHDLVAAPKLAEQLAARFRAPCVYVDGAHFIPRENAWEVAQLLRLLVSLSNVRKPSSSHHHEASIPAAADDPRHSLDSMALNLTATAGATTPAAAGAEGKSERSERPGEGAGGEARQGLAVAAQELNPLSAAADGAASAGQAVMDAGASAGRAVQDAVGGR